MKINGVIASGESQIGHKQAKNDDRSLIQVLDEEHLLLAVSDGMGGHPAGDIAAEDIMNCLNQIDTDMMDKSKSLSQAINRADMIIRNRVEKDPLLEGMGATATAAIISNTKTWWAHIGDSRMYLMRKGIIQRMTRDHSFLQDLIDSGDVPIAEAADHPMAHVLDQCVGCIDTGIDSGIFPVSPGDKIFLCTDGLYRAISDIKIAEILSSNNSVSGCIEQLIGSSIQSKSLDDSTAIVAYL
jgi:serine/threonine protein phosphatase PrpC